MVENYGWTHEYALKLPMKRFWFYHRMVDRLRAERDLRQVYLLAGITSQEGYENLNERLAGELGKILVYQPAVPQLNINEDDDNPDPSFDREGLEALRANIMRHGR